MASPRAKRKVSKVSYGKLPTRTGSHSTASVGQNVATWGDTLCRLFNKNSLWGLEKCWQERTVYWAKRNGNRDTVVATGKWQTKEHGSAK